ncbi:ATP-binding cassette domain-containing protein [Floccifex sp.]|uniref:ABC transporter ATP-binding protein n=1 Tax=Floccifex sp. TaxID=2815810 RepID=UPI003F034D2B
MKAIQISQLTKYYGKAKGIENVSLEVDKGDFFGFIGPNGAGKSTTIRTLLGLLQPDSGKALINGMDITQKKEEILKHVGYLPSEVNVYASMKVKDVLKLSAQLQKKDCTTYCQELCSRLQLDVNKKVQDLSFGNRKKAGIVCALQHKPDVLILDEPTSGLDPLMQREFFEILKERNQEGATIFLSSHVLSEIQRYCNKAAIIQNGTIIACNEIEELAKTNTKRVHIQGKIRLDDLKGVKDIFEDKDSQSFLYSGDIQLLLQELSKGNVKDISISEPDLEEIFMHYYERK